MSTANAVKELFVILKYINIIFNSYFNASKSTPVDDLPYACQTDDLTTTGYKAGECPYDAALTTDSFDGWIYVCNLNDIHENPANVNNCTGGAWFKLDNYRDYDNYYGTYNLTDDKPKDTDNFKLGDVNSDNKITAKDSMLIQRHAVHLITLDETQLKAADVNGDGRVTNKDALAILIYYRV